MSNLNIPKPGVFTILLIIVTALSLWTFNRGVNQEAPNFLISNVDPFQFEVIDSVEHVEYLEYQVKVTNISKQYVEYAQTQMFVGDHNKNKRMESYFEKIGDDYASLKPNESIIISYKIDGFPNEYVKSYWFEVVDIQ